MKLSSAVIDLLIQGHKDVIVGPYANTGTVHAKIAGYNKTHLVEVKVKQQRLLLVDPENLKMEKVWRVTLLQTRENNKKLLRGGWPK